MPIRRWKLEVTFEDCMSKADQYDEKELEIELHDSIEEDLSLRIKELKLTELELT